MAENPLNHASDADLLDTAIPIDGLGDAEEVTEEQLENAKALRDEEDLVPIDIASDDEHIENASIQTFGPTDKAHAEIWKRKPNVTGRGAIHVKTFVAKLRLDAIDHLDAQINSWLDEHPEYEVKFVTTSHGELKGKTNEEALFMSVWV